MGSALKGKLRVIDEILAQPPISSVLFKDLSSELEEAGSKPCSVLLGRAIRHREDGDWDGCREAALKAREYAWEQLHSGPSWQAVATVHRDAYGAAGTLVAAATFLSDEANSLDQAVFTLDLVAMMAGGRFQGVANTFVEAMEADALANTGRATGVATGKLTCVRRGTPSMADGVSPILEPCHKRTKRGRLTALGQPVASGESIRRIRMPPLHVFQRDFMESATPVILLGVLDGWPAMEPSRDWSNPSYIRKVAGRRTVPVELGGTYTGDGWRQELMTIGDFIDRFIEPDTEGEPRTRDMNVTVDRSEKAYLAQHQLFDQIPALKRDIMTPDYCALLLEDEEDDRDAQTVATNAWFGPAGTVSPLHNDPFHNLLAQVVGTKRVLLVDRKLSGSVYPRPGLMTNTSEVDAANPNLSKYPRFEEAMPLLECELRRGEVLYIPPLFWHHIESLEGYDQVCRKCPLPALRRRPDGFASALKAWKWTVADQRQKTPWRGQLMAAELAISKATRASHTRACRPHLLRHIEFLEEAHKILCALRADGREMNKGRNKTVPGISDSPEMNAWNKTSRSTSAWNISTPAQETAVNINALSTRNGRKKSPPAQKLYILQCIAWFAARGDGDGSDLVSSNSRKSTFLATKTDFRT